MSNAENSPGLGRGRPEPDQKKQSFKTFIYLKNVRGVRRRTPDAAERTRLCRSLYVKGLLIIIRTDLMTVAFANTKVFFVRYDIMPLLSHTRVQFSAVRKFHLVSAGFGLRKPFVPPLSHWVGGTVQLRCTMYLSLLQWKVL